MPPAPGELAIRPEAYAVDELYNNLADIVLEDGFLLLPLELRCPQGKCGWRPVAIMRAWPAGSIFGGRARRTSAFAAPPAFSGVVVRWVSMLVSIRVPCSCFVAPLSDESSASAFPTCKTLPLRRQQPRADDIFPLTTSCAATGRWHGHEDHGSFIALPPPRYDRTPAHAPSATGARPDASLT